MDALHVFGCGVNKKYFETKFKALDQEDQQRLERVARRVWITLKLKYELGAYQNPFESPNERFILAHYELPAMGIYLLVTCLDTLAGKARFVDFRDWLKNQPDEKDLTWERIINLYTRYTDECGVGKNLHALFNNLPHCTKEWLARNVVIQEVDEPLSAEGQDPNLLLKRLYKYFYETRRNEYTHSSYPKQVSTADDIRLPDEDGWWVTPASGTHFILDRRKPNKLWNFSYRQGLDEATILRLIIHSGALQMLNIQVTEDLLILNLRNFSRLDALYSFMGEVASNADILKLWSNIEELNGSDFKPYLIYTGVPVISDQAARRMVDRYDIDKGWESSYHQITLQYIKEINHLNALITDFNQKNPHAKPMQDNNEARWEAITVFLNELSRTPAAHSVLKLPTTNEMTNLWLIIRDPCYI